MWPRNFRAGLPRRAHILPHIRLRGGVGHAQTNLAGGSAAAASGSGMRGAVAPAPLPHRRSHLPGLTRAAVAGGWIFAAALRRQKCLLLLSHVGADGGRRAPFPLPRRAGGQSHRHRRGPDAALPDGPVEPAMGSRGPLAISQSGAVFVGRAGPGRTAGFSAAAGGRLSGRSGQSRAGGGGDPSFPLPGAGRSGSSPPGGGGHAAGRRLVGPVEPAILDLCGDQRRHHRLVPHHLAFPPAHPSAPWNAKRPGRQHRSGRFSLLAAFPRALTPPAKIARRPASPGP